MPPAASSICALSTLGTSTRRRRIVIVRGDWSRRGHGQGDRRPLCALEHVGRLLRRHVLRRDAVDGENAVAGAEAGLFSGAAVDDADDRQLGGVALQLDPQADEIALDLRIDLAELIGREVGRIGIEAVGRPADEFEDRRGGTDFGAALGQGGGRGDGFVGLLPGGDGPAGRRLPEFAAERVDRGPVLLGDVLLAESRFAQGDVEVVDAALDELLPVRRFDVVRLDFHEHAVVELHRPVRRQLDQRVAEAAVGVTAVEVVMEPGRLDAPLEAAFAGEEPHGVLVIGQRFAPTAIALQLPPAPQQIVDLQRAAADGQRGGLLGGEGEGRERGEGGKPQSGGVEYPLRHGFIRDVWEHPTQGPSRNIGCNWALSKAQTPIFRRPALTTGKSVPTGSNRNGEAIEERKIVICRRRRQHRRRRKKGGRKKAEAGRVGRTQRAPPAAQ